MAEFKNEFSWSKSREGVFDECRRKYYFNHYGSWRGWETNAPEKIRETYILKNLISKEMWVGQVVHDLIKYLFVQLKEGNSISLNGILFRLKKRMEGDFISSENKLYKKNPKWNCGLFEHEYEIEISPKEKDYLFELAERCITNFYNSDIFQELEKTNPDSWIIIESALEPNPNQPQSFDFEGTRIWLKIDLAVRNEEGVTIYDWKTGKKVGAEIDIQLVCYALYAIQRWNLKPEQVTIKRYNIAINRCDEFNISNEQIHQIKEYIGESVKEMKKILRDEKNNIAEEEDFLKTTNDWVCSRCNFRKVC